MTVQLPVPTPRFLALLDEALKLLDAGEIIIVGSGMLALEGLRDVNDLDLIVMPEVLKRLRAQGVSKTRSGQYQCDVIETPAGRIDIGDRLVFPLLKDASIALDRIKLAPLPNDRGYVRVLQWPYWLASKAAHGRVKDWNDIARLARHFAATMLWPTQPATSPAVSPPGRCSTRCDHDSQCTLSAGHGDRHETDHGCICYDHRG